MSLRFFLAGGTPVAAAGLSALSAPPPADVRRALSSPSSSLSSTVTSAVSAGRTGPRASVAGRLSPLLAVLMAMAWSLERLIVFSLERLVVVVFSVVGVMVVLGLSVEISYPRAFSSAGGAILRDLGICTHTHG